MARRESAKLKPDKPNRIDAFVISLKKYLRASNVSQLELVNLSPISGQPELTSGREMSPTVPE